MPLLFGDFFKLVLEFLLFSASGFMILLVLVQRGRGGGLTGALGGMGGQSAFGAKAGDVFTRITVISAIIWIFLCLITIRSYAYVPVNTTAMKEYQYTKLMKDESVGFGDEKDLSSSLNLGRNPDDGPGASISSIDSEADKASGKKAEKESEDSDPNGKGDNTIGSKKESEGKAEAGKAEAGKAEAGKAEAGKAEAGKGETPKKDKDAKDENAKDSAKEPSKKENDESGKNVDPKSDEKKSGGSGEPDKSK